MCGIGEGDFPPSVPIKLSAESCASVSFLCMQLFSLSLPHMNSSYLASSFMFAIYLHAHNLHRNFPAIFSLLVKIFTPETKLSGVGSI